MATKKRFDRQSFLGLRSQEQIEEVVIGIVGVGGGGSHVVQQLRHIGFKKYVIYDSQPIEESNLNRMVGATERDVKKSAPKVEIMKRIIKGLGKNAEVAPLQCRWQDDPEKLRTVDIIIGCVDKFSERDELEIFCRRYLIPYIDIGMDVHLIEGYPPKIAGQVILSMPGYSCMRCMGFLTEKTLAKEAANYGAAGSNPQVVWSNGILASTAISIAVDLITDWTKLQQGPVFLSYDGNKKTIRSDPRLDYIEHTHCPHYSMENIGDPGLILTPTRSKSRR